MLVMVEVAVVVVVDLSVEWWGCQVFLVEYGVFQNGNMNRGWQ